MNNNLKNVMIVFLFLIAGSLILFVFTESKLLESKNEQAIKEVQTEHRLLIQELEAGSNK